MKYSLLKSIIRIVLLGLLCGVLVFFTQEKLTLKALFWERGTHHNSSAPLQLISTVDLAEALRLFNSPDVVFVDVRGLAYYKYGHIKNAVSLPVLSLSTIPIGQLSSLKTKMAVVVYCNGTSCGDAFLAARLLADRGLTNVSVYTQGWPEWRSCRLPMEMSTAMLNEGK